MHYCTVHTDDNKGENGNVAGDITSNTDVLMVEERNEEVEVDMLASEIFGSDGVFIRLHAVGII